MIRRSLGRFVPIFYLLCVFGLPVFPDQAIVDKSLLADDSLLIRSPSDLQLLLYQWQQLSVPSVEPSVKDAGMFIFSPDGMESESFFNALLPDPSHANASVVFVEDDDLSGYTFFYDLLGDPIYALPLLDTVTDGDDGITLRVSLWTFFNRNRSETEFETLLSNLQRSRGISGNSRKLERLARLMLERNAILSRPAAAFAETNDFTERQRALEPNDEPSLSKVVYVDAKQGNDSLSGRAASVKSGHEGPKRSVRSGVAELVEEDVLVIREGHYAEDLNLRDKDVRVRIEGTVVLRDVIDSDTAKEQVTP